MSKRRGARLSDGNLATHANGEPSRAIGLRADQRSSRVPSRIRACRHIYLYVCTYVRVCSIQCGGLTWTYDILYYVYYTYGYFLFRHLAVRAQTAAGLRSYRRRWYRDSSRAVPPPHPPPGRNDRTERRTARIIIVARVRAVAGW